jgi:hypothetical protein
MEAFNTLMFEALDDTLKAVLGKNASELIHVLTKKHLSVKAKENKNTIEVILSYLEKLIGKEGTQVIQAASIKRLCLKLQQEYEEVEAHFSVLDELYEMKFKLLTPIQNEKNKTSEPN